MKVLPVGLTLAAALALIALSRPCSGEEAVLSLPSGYRSWTHVKSMVILPGHPLYGAFGGMHHVYVNDVGLPASKSGGPYPDGAILVFDLFESPAKDNAHVAGDRKITAVMVKDSRRFRATGGWGFGGFKPNNPANVVKDAVGECFGCHTAQKGSDYVFSRFVE